MDILHRISIDAGPEEVLPKITTANGFREWWTSDCEAEPRAGTVHRFRFLGGSVEFPFRVDELTPRRVAWTCLSDPRTPPEWIGTRVTFDLSTGPEDRTVLSFAHSGWPSADGDLPQCNTVWGDLMHRLKAAAEGHPRGPYFPG